MTKIRNAKIGTILAMTMTVLMVTASRTPPMISRVKPQTKAEAAAIESRLLPSPKMEKK